MALREINTCEARLISRWPTQLPKTAHAPTHNFFPSEGWPWEFLCFFPQAISDSWLYGPLFSALPLHESRISATLDPWIRGLPFWPCLTPGSRVPQFWPYLTPSFTGPCFRVCRSTNPGFRPRWSPGSAGPSFGHALLLAPRVPVLAHRQFLAVQISVR